MEFQPEIIVSPFQSDLHQQHFIFMDGAMDSPSPENTPPVKRAGAPSGRGKGKRLKIERKLSPKQRQRVSALAPGATAGMNLKRLAAGAAPTTKSAESSSSKESSSITTDEGSETNPSISDTLAYRYYGANDTATDAHLIQQLEAAINSFPKKSNSAYFMALKKDPLLVQKESNPIAFLRHADCNSTSAARRMLSYWDKRYSIFGERAFEPMVQTGNGALDHEDLRLLATGFISIAQKDELGRPVLFFDRSKLTKDGKTFEESRLRCIFYMLQIIASDATAQSLGYIVMRLVTPEFRLSIASAIELLDETFPIQCSGLHILCQTPPGAQRMIAETAVPAIIKSIGERLKDITQVHLMGSAKETQTYLAQNSLAKCHLPIELGGSWLRVQDFLKWQIDRQEMERMEHLTDLTAQPPSSRQGLLKKPPRPLKTPLSSDEEPMNLKKSGSPTNPTFKSTSARKRGPPGTVTSNLIAELERALDAIPIQEKQAMLEAQEQAPHLIQDESNFAAMLACENYNPQGAARRVVQYWELRKELFGSRAYLQMSQMGEGTLSRGDISLLGSGFLVLLTNASNCDSLLCYDGSRLVKTAKDCQLRVAFYMISIAAENCRSQEEGIVILHVIDKLAPTSRDRRQSLSHIFDVLPVRTKEIHAFHWLNPESSSATDKSLENPIVEKLKAASRAVFGESQSQTIICHTVKDQTLLALDKRGIRKSSLPKHLGGEWGYENFVQWQELRTRFEWDLPPGIGGKDDAEKLFDFSGVKNLSELNEDEKIERKRRMNVLHSRRKREREKVEIEVLQEQCDDWAEKNRVATLERTRLEGLMARAQEEILRVESANIAPNQVIAEDEASHEIQLVAPSPSRGAPRQHHDRREAATLGRTSASLAAGTSLSLDLSSRLTRTMIRPQEQLSWSWAAQNQALVDQRQHNLVREALQQQHQLQRQQEHLQQQQLLRTLTPTWNAEQTLLQSGMLSHHRHRIMEQARLRQVLLEPPYGYLRTFPNTLAFLNPLHPQTPLSSMLAMASTSTFSSSTTSMMNPPGEIHGTPLHGSIRSGEDEKWSEATHPRDPNDLPSSGDDDPTSSPGPYHRFG